MSENRVSNSQINELLDFLAAHPRMANSTGTGLRDKERHERLWDQIACNLNSHLNGTKKTGLRWRRYWADIKHKTKARLMNRRQSNGAAPDEDLGEIDKRIWAIMCKAPKKPNLLDVEVPDYILQGSSNSQQNDSSQHSKVWPTTITLTQGTRDDNDTVADPLIQFLPVKDMTEEDEASDSDQPNLKKLSSKNPEFAWLMEMDERRVACEEKIAEAASQMAQAAVINADAAKTIAQATLMMAQSQKTLLDLLKTKLEENNLDNT